MKNLLLVGLIFFSVGNLFPQKKYSKNKIRKHYARVYTSKIKGTTILSLDTIFTSGIPYAILRKKKQLPYNNFGLYSVNNNKLISIQTGIGINKDKALYYAFRFTESNQTAELEKYFGFDIVKTIVENKLVNDNKIDPLYETLFLIKFPRKFSDTSIKTFISDKPDESTINTTNIYETVKRNRESAFYFNDGKIMQDYKIVGRYKILQSTIIFYLPNGIKVAEADEIENPKHSWRVLSLKDNRTGHIQPDRNNAITELISYLLKNFYL